MKKAIVFLANGFEEMEATGTVDVLRRGGIGVKTVSITNERKVVGAHHMEYMADALFSEIDFSDVDALILPGGMPGSSNLNECEPLKERLIEQYKNNKIVAAICAAPMVLGGLGLLKGRRATCYPGFEPKLIGVPDDMGAFTELLWNSLNEENKVSLFVRYIDIETGKYETKIVNKNQ